MIPNDIPISTDPASLREQAERFLACGLPVEGAMSAQEDRRLVHELRVHQIELELQNEELRASEKALAAALTRVNHLYDVAPVGYLTLAEDFRILEANLAAAAMLGRERAGLVGRAFTGFVAPQSQDLLWIHRQNVLASDCKQSCELCLCRGNETVFPAQLESQRNDDVCSGESCWQLVLIDISERSQAEQALRRSEESFRVLAELVPDLLFSCDERGYWNYVSPRFQELTGITTHQSQSKSWMQAIHPGDLPRLKQGWSVATARNEPFEDRFRLRLADGAYRWFMGRCRPVWDEKGQVTKWLGCNTDIDAIVQSQEALQEASHRKDEFLATFAHELRNPLAPLRNALEYLRLTRETDGGERSADRFLDLIERQVKHLTRLGDDLLEAARISQGKIELVREPVALAEIISQAVETSQPLIDAKQHRLTVSLPPQPVILDADPVRLTQVFANLLNNAAQYTGTGGSLEVAAQLQAETLMVSVRDTGIGIAAQELPRLFEPFIQIKQGDNRYHSGLGIGLALARRLVELHGGRITVHSAGPGQGSEFRVYLPRSEADLRDDAGTTAIAGALSRHRILLVDDNRDAADSLAMLLSLGGAQVHTVYSGREALAVIDSFQPTVVLLDLGMPEMDGFELTRHIRSRHLDCLPLIALSGWGQEADRIRSRAAGLDHHLVKPVSIDQLQNLLASL